MERRRIDWRESGGAAKRLSKKLSRLERTENKIYHQEISRNSTTIKGEKMSWEKDVSH